MIVVVKTKDVNLRIPVPIGMAALAVKVIPENVYRQMSKDVPSPYNMLCTKQAIGMLLEECMGVLKENKRLEVIHVEAADGTYVSVRL